MKISKNWSFFAMLIVGMFAGLGISQFINPLAETSPEVRLGQNDGRIIAFDVRSWPTPNFLFQQEGDLPIVLYPAVGSLPTVSLLDGRVMTYQEFVEDFQSIGRESYDHALFSVDYQENNIDELGYVMSIKQIR